MTKHVKVSIALASYNGHRYLKEQIQSILNQTYHNIELIISDDHSCDGTQDLISKFVNSDTRVSLIVNNDRRGFVNNFENAISHCSGEFIALADQDDIWELDKIDKLVRGIGAFSLIHSDASLINMSGNCIFNSYTLTAKKNILNLDVVDVILNNPVTGCTTMFHHSLLDKALPFPEKLAVHDKWLALLALLDQGIVYYDEPLVKYRQHDGNQIGAAIKSKSLIVKYKKLRLNKERIIHNEKYQYELIKTLINNQEKSLSISMLKELNLLKIYYENIINKKFPVIAFIIRCFLFTRFEKGKSFKVKIIALFSIFKRIFC
ncbi:glycosyltransferase family 2 protein [Psychromonas sp. RZ22]|uniref:glycosyltransferase family 2 protein n=1 Tax=Psychromonas algarum TaxID=2555643 RepID=UPI001068316D|nr:glycosyltransferase family 2 protein [Psychromonas sp. RZ22]TEW55749.1 glycosyltransferase family 2 protein [Psychromonas sp. RZ22]